VGESSSTLFGASHLQLWPTEFHGLGIFPTSTSASECCINRLEKAAPLSASGAMFLQKQRMSDRSGLLQKLLSKISLAGLATGNLACETDVASNPTNLRIFRPEPFDGCHRQTSSTNVKFDIRGSRSARSPADLVIGPLLPQGMDKSEDMRNVPLR
jgi:hypothetical protein